MARLRFVTATDDLISWAIRGAELGFWCSHVEAVMPNGTYLGAHADGGVLARPVGYDKRWKPEELFVDVPATPEQDLAFQTFLEQQLGKPYDMDVIRGFAIGTLIGAKDWRQPGHWICSELQAAALEHAGLVAPFGGRIAQVTPRDLLFAVGAIVELGVPEMAYQPYREAAS